MICLLHSNELPFRDYFRYCDASGANNWKKTTGPGFYGHIGRHFKDYLELKPIVPFDPIPGKVPVFDAAFVATFNNDTRYFYQVIQAIQTGIFPAWLVFKVIGKVHSAR